MTATGCMGGKMGRLAPHVIWMVWERSEIELSRRDAERGRDLFA
jgi:hypothetical protein